ncbi:ImmA/IrrE family metallo-endopeptidase [Pseudomonas sp. P867]|uniref:XRE family transcriptional regulator n=1 Tax=Pseudomonas sp. P867 TaxID=2816050 RepID=UPI001CA6EA83|nr:XRE family transcriptional regulator [Pseudomonas sp. P867]MBY8970322.1 ImmA/IrrE family metallo-endopeptidase [Pseudomonas sp. P867]
MIYNERQYQSAHKQLEKLCNSLNTFQPSGVVWLDAAQLEAIESKILDIKSEIKEYELIKEGKVSYLECSGLSELPKTLIYARIGLGLTQKNLAEKLGIPAQQLQRYEASSYMGASLARLISVAEVLNVKIRESWSGANANTADSVFCWNSVENIDWSLFPAQEMVKRGWITVQQGSSTVDQVRDYFLCGGGQYTPALHRKKFHGENKPNEYALLAWQARALELAREEVLSGAVSEYEHTDSWIKELSILTQIEGAPLIAKKFLAARGIVLVIEKHLPGTYLDGAAMVLETGHPVVALTLRYDRLDNFWFVLFHELAHISLHIFDSLQMDYFDEEGEGEGDLVEREADEFALEALISSESWDSCISRFSMTPEAVLLDAERIGVHPSILAGRIRKESNNYHKLTELLGNGKVRSCFEEQL